MDILLYILYLVLGLVALVLVVVLFVPVQLIVDSTRSRYMLRMPFVAHLRVHMVNVDPIASLWVLGYTKELNLIDEARKQIRQSEAKREKRIRDERESKTEAAQRTAGTLQTAPASNDSSTGSKPEKKKRAIPWRRLRACLNSFQVRTASIIVDTGIDEWNAWLYPLAYAVAQVSPLRVQPNFIGQNSVRVYVQNSVARLLWAFTFPTFFIHHSRRVV